MEDAVTDLMTFTVTDAGGDGDDDEGLHVYGLEDYRFLLLHVTGLVSLTISIVISASVMFYLNYPFQKSLWSRPIGERLVVYLSAFDLLYSISHVLDHSYMMVTKHHPPDAACATFGFFLHEFSTAQTMLVAFTAVNAFYMVVKKTQLGLGKRDWKLLAGMLGIPAILGVIAGATGYLGPTGIWCHVDARTKLAVLLNNIVMGSMIGSFITILGCYAAVWLTIRRQAKLQASQKASKYHRIARIMMIFVVAYVAQWWPFIVMSIWILCTGAEAPLAVNWASVFFCNMGGVFNFMAYTLVRRRYQRVQETEVTKSTAVTHA